MARVRSNQFLGVVCVLAILSASWASADVIVLTNEYTLEEVMAMPGGFRVEDKVFSDWSFTDNSQNGGLAPTPGGIKLEGVYFDLDGNGQLDPMIDEIGLRFTGGWSAYGQQIVDTVIRFKVTADDPYMIEDNTLWMSSGAGANGGQASITESVYDTPAPSNPVAVKYVYHNEDDSLTLVHMDYPQAYKEVWIIKDVQVNGGVQAGGSAAISEFYQTFSQIPEPAALVLLGLGGMGLLFRRRRRK